VAGSGFVLFLIGRNIIKNDFYALCIMLTYFLFVGLQNAVITDFHEVTIATFLFMLVFLFIVRKKIKLYFLSLILLLGCKESMFLVGIGISIAIFLLQKPWRRIAFGTFLVSIIWGMLATKTIIPFFSGGIYFYDTQLSSNPLDIVKAFFDPQIKQRTLFYTFFSFGFLPILSPAFWSLMFQDFLVRFYPSYSNTRWDFGLHYSALTAVIMALSSVYTCAFLKQKLKPKILTVIMIAVLLNAVFLYRFVLHGPLALSYNPAFYTHTKDFIFLNEVVNKIPKNASIMTQNNLASHFTHQRVWLLVSDNNRFPKEYYTLKNPDYILIDNRAGQNPNNFFGVKDMNLLLKNLNADKNYQLVYKTGEQFIFKRKN
jgi:uncharacterized membrane protein